MWFRGSIQATRSARFDVKRINAHRVSWSPRVANYDAPIKISPWEFAYAVARTSAIGGNLRLPGRIAGLSFAAACLSHLVRDGVSDLKAHPDFSLLKDFVGTSLKGVIGAALAYREMQDLGYSWVGHWEDCVLPVTGPHPDFVYAAHADVCVVDAKGSMAAQAVVEDRCRSEWSRQIKPQSAAMLKGGGSPTEGRVVGTVLSITAPAVVVAAHGRFNTHRAPAFAAASTGKLAVIRANYADVADLLGERSIAAAMRANSDQRLQGVEIFQTFGTTTQIDNNDEVLLGPVRLVLPDSNEGLWSMRVFCRAIVFSHAVNLLTRQPYYSGGRPTGSDFEVAQLFLGTQRRAIEFSDSNRIIIQSTDGVGALFERVH